MFPFILCSPHIAQYAEDIEIIKHRDAKGEEDFQVCKVATNGFVQG